MSLVAIVAFMVWGFSPMLVGLLGDRRHVRGVVPAPRHGDGLAQGRRRAARRLRPDAERRRHLRGRRDHRRRRRQDRLGLKFSAIVIAYAGGSLFLTALYTALIVWVIGLAVPVTASYIICAVIAAPALTKLGVPDFAAHMFIFYYAVLSEVSPPTALSPFAAAAITGGDPYRTTLQSWKYTLPAFVVPFVFVLDPAGVGAAAQDAAGRLVAARRVDRVDRVHRDRRARRRHAEVAAARRARSGSAGRSIVCGLLLVYPAPAADVVGLAGVARCWRAVARAAARGCLRAVAAGRSAMRKVDELFERYGESHRNPINEAIHWVCVPLITWSVLAGAPPDCRPRAACRSLRAPLTATRGNRTQARVRRDRALHAASMRSQR